jgi:hypothetical protein
MSTKDFTPEVCECCGQTTQLLYPIDAGTADIVKAVAVAVGNKGINMVHLRKELEVDAKEWNYGRMLREGVLTSNHIGNGTRPRKHGLIAFASIDGKREIGNYLLTKKGAAFLRGESVPKYAIQNKVTGHIEGYWKPNVYRVTIHDLWRKDTDRWEGIDFDIEEGRIIHDLPEPKQQTLV